MKLQQLRFLATVAQSELNITTAAAKLYTTQPAVSKQLCQLEDELGFKIFVRRGRALSKVALPGERVVDCAVRVLREIHDIKGISTDYKDDSSGTLSIGIGVGIVANMAIDPHQDADLVVLEAGRLFPNHITWVGFDRSALLR